MSELKATPGPWKAFQWGDGSQAGTDFWNVGSDVAEVVLAKDLPAKDAHLISAAPDLYEALAVLLNSVETSGNPEWRDSLMHRQCVKALAKARGEEV